MKKKIFTEKQVDISALLAGPIPPGLLIYRNYIALGKEGQAYKALASTLIFTILFFYGIFQIPEHVIDQIPNAAFTLFYGVLVFIFFRKFLADDVNEAIQSGVEKGSNWAVAGYTVLGLIINLAIAFGLANYEPFYEGEVVEVNGNELYFDSSVPERDVNMLVEQFKTNDFFGPDYGNIARLQIINNKYFITVVVDESLWSDQGVIDFFRSLKWIMETEYGKTTNLKLESVSLSGKSIYKEL